MHQFNFQNVKLIKIDGEHEDQILRGAENPFEYKICIY